MRIAVMGAGGVGGYFGGLLARAGDDVTLIARGSHLEAIRAGGLRVNSHWGDFTVQVNATDQPQEVGPVDLVMLSVKTYQNSVAIPALAPLVGDDTCLLSLQNGASSYEDLARSVGKERVLPGAVYFEGQVQSPGVIRQTGEIVRIVFGEVSSEQTPRAQRILETFQAAGITTELSSDIVKDLWTKALFISTMAGVTSTSRASMAQLLPRPESRATVVAAMCEAEAVARAKGVNLDPGVVDRTLHYMDSAVKDLHASMHTDLELGRPLELEALNGAVVRIGRELGVPTPVNDVLYSLLLPHKDGRAVGT